MKTLLATLIVFLFCLPTVAMAKLGDWYGEDAGLILTYGTIISEECEHSNHPTKNQYQCRFIVTVDIQQSSTIWNRNPVDMKKLDYEGVWYCVVENSYPENFTSQFCFTHHMP